MKASREQFRTSFVFDLSQTWKKTPDNVSNLTFYIWVLSQKFGQQMSFIHLQVWALVTFWVNRNIYIIHYIVFWCPNNMSKENVNKLNKWVLSSEDMKRSVWWEECQVFFFNFLYLFILHWSVFGVSQSKSPSRRWRRGRETARLSDL